MKVKIDPNCSHFDEGVWYYNLRNLRELTFDVEICNDKHLYKVISQELYIPIKYALVINDSKSILNEQCKHSIIDCLNELKYGRPAYEQKQIGILIEMINFLNEKDESSND